MMVYKLVASEKMDNIWLATATLHTVPRKGTKS